MRIARSTCRGPARDDIRAAFASARPTALIHAAGILRVGALGELDAEAGAAMWRLHVEEACLLADAIVPGMASGGRIILIGSRVAAGAAQRSQYAATKSALIGLARSWAIELAPRGITVNVVAPGATETPMLLDPERAGVAPRLPPIGRFIKPEEVAALTAFLLSVEAGGHHGPANRGLRRGVVVNSGGEDRPHCRRKRHAHR